MYTLNDLANALVPNQPAACTGYRIPCTEAPATTAADYICPKKVYPMTRDQMEIYNNIDVEAPDSEAEIARNYLKSRLSNIFWRQDRKLENQFGLTDDDPPKGMTDTLARIKSGKFVVRDEHKEGRCWLDKIRWRDPDVKEDQKGYDAARLALEDARTEVADSIAIESADKALKAVKDFAEWTYSKKKA